MIDLSINEATALARKATRGAGHDWSTADEAGRAVRWLCSHGMPGSRTLADLLTDPDVHAPQIRDGVLTGAGPLCPLRSGIALCDLAGLPGWTGQRLAPVAQPLLLLPFIALASKGIGKTLQVEGPQILLVAAHTGPLDPDQWRKTADILVRPVSAAAPQAHRQTRAALTPAILATLTTLAHRTYAPATEQSRALGAGGTE